MPPLADVPGRFTSRALELCPVSARADYSSPVPGTGEIDPYATLRSTRGMPRSWQVFLAYPATPEMRLTLVEVVNALARLAGMRNVIMGKPGY
jgi:hypothetical protein